MAGQVEIQFVPETRVAYMRYVGPYGMPGITHLWQRFQFWCLKEKLTSSRHRMFGIAQDNPNITPPERTRYDACIQVEANFQPRDGIGVQTIRGGRYACTPFTGTAADIRAAWIKFLTRTLPEARVQPDLAPAIEIYAPDHVVNVRTGAFSCLLCMPLRSS